MQLSIPLLAFLLIVTSCSLPQRPATAPHVPLMPNATQALSKLKQGNQRFANHMQKHPDQGGKRVHQLAQGQHPIATVLACADSRVPPEIVFDQGLGDLFVVREAGHVADDATLGSIEYAVEHLKTPLIVVLGHESCGAVTAAVDVMDSHQSAGGHIQRLVEDIRPAVQEAGTHGSRESRIARAVTANVRLVMGQLTRNDAALAKAVRAGAVRIVGAVYDLNTGKITWL
ncbi:MAG: carbonic anhydrase [Prosthecobacter sp.]|nr:carbonic anhydrase [Prosthecobacter sp.]